MQRTGLCSLMAITKGVTDMVWSIHYEGYYYCDVPGFSFQVGEWHHGTWLLKYWKRGATSSTWVTCETLQDALLMADKIAKEGVVE